MALKAKLTADEHGKLASALQSEYTKQTDGTFLLAVESIDGFALENVLGLKNALSAERTTAAQLKAQIESFKDIDPTKAREALQKLAELGDISKLKGEDKVNAQIAAIKAEFETKMRTDNEAHTKRNQFLEGIIRKNKVDDAARAALAAHGLDENGIDLLMPHVIGSLRCVEDGGKFVAQVIDQAGNPRITAKQGSTAPMDVAEFVETMKANDKYKMAFPASKKVGSGATTHLPNGGESTDRKNGRQQLAEALG